MGLGASGSIPPHFRPVCSPIRPPTKILLLFLFAALCAVAWVVFGAASQPQEDWDEVAYQSAVQGEDAELRSAAERRRSEARSDPRAIEIQRDVVADPRAQARTVAAPVRAVVEAEGFPVLVLRADTKLPVPEATVFFFDSLSPRYRLLRRSMRSYRADREEALSRLGERALADGQGIAILPHGIPSQTVTVRWANLYGEVAVSGKRPPPEGGYRVELLPDRSIRVQVVDGMDHPVTGVHLAFYISVVEPGKGQRWVLWRDPNRDVSASDGIQSLPHIQQFVALLQRLSQAEAVVHLGLDLPGLTRCGPTLRLDAPPDHPLAPPTDGPVRIELPPTGKIVAQVLDSEGMPVQRRVRLSAEPDFTVARTKRGPKQGGAERPAWERTTDAEGRVRFDRVALGQRYRVECLGADVTQEERVDLEGPRTPGEVVEVDLAKPFTAARIEGVAVGENGTPLVERVLTFAAGRAKGDKDTGYLTRGRVTTDAAGRFTIRLPPTRSAVDAKQRPVEFNLYSGLRLALAGQDAGPGSEITIQRRLQAARYSVGIVRLRELATVVSGRVYIDGKPARFFDRFLLESRDPASTGRWQRASGLAVRAQRGGTFEVRGDLGGRNIRLRVRSWGFLPVAPVPLRPGMADLEIRLTTGGAMRVAVLYDEATADAKLEVRLEPIHLDGVEMTPALGWQFVGRVDRRGSGNERFRRAYWWNGLPRGSYRMTLRLLGSPRPFRVLENVEPTFGIPMEDTPIAVFNLRGAVQRVRVLARDGAGRPLSGMVFPLGQNLVGTREGVRFGRKGAVLHTTDPGGVDLRVVVRGYRPETVQRVSGTRQVTLRAGIPVTLAIAMPRLPRGVGLRATLRRRDLDRTTLYRNDLRHPVRAEAAAQPLAALMGEKTVRLRRRGRNQWKATLMQEGAFTVDLELVRKGASPVRLRDYSPGRLTLRDSDSEQRFSVTVPPKSCAAALRDLDQKK